MKEFSATGTLGDTFIGICKLSKIKEDIKMYHHTIHKYWYDNIWDLYSFLPNIKEVEFVESPREDLIEITSNCHEQDMDFFPNFTIYPDLIDEQYKPYTVIQPHSGKPKGFNRKDLDINYIQSIVNKYKDKGINSVILGTDSYYEQLENCYKHINTLSLSFIYEILKQSIYFIGPEGLLSFMALSNKVHSSIFYSEKEAIQKRIIGTPWEKYVSEFVNLRGN